MSLIHSPVALHWSAEAALGAHRQGRSIFYIVGDGTTQSSEYEFRVPPLPGAKKITIIACSPPLPSPKFFDWFFLLKVAVLLCLRLVFVSESFRSAAKYARVEIPREPGRLSRRLTRTFPAADADQGVGYPDHSFNGRDASNGIDALGVAMGAISDVNALHGDLIINTGCRPIGGLLQDDSDPMPARAVLLPDRSRSMSAAPAAR